MKDNDMKMLPSKKYWKELNTKGKIDFFLQYYKWPAIIVLCLSVFLMITIKQVMTADRPDMLLMLISDKGVPPQYTNLMQESMKSYVHDIDGDGKKFLKIMTIVNADATAPGYNAEAAYGNDVTLSIQTGAGYPLLFVISPSEYTRLSKQIGYPFKDISLYTNKSVDGKAVRIKDTKLIEMQGFSDFPEDYLICMLDKTTNFKGKKADEMQKFTQDAFYKIIQ